MSPHDTHTRHKEYSFIPAVFLSAVLIFFQTPQSKGLLAIISVLSILSILYSAFSVVRHADVLAHRFGEPYGSLILSLAIVVLEASLISILMLSGSAGSSMMRDTIYSVIMIVMGGFVGVALLLGGEKYDTQYFNCTGIKHFMISIIPMGIIVLGLPTLMEGNTLSTAQLCILALCCLLIYVFFLKIQTVTHRQFFIHEHEDDDGEHHGKPSAHKTWWHFLMLCLHLVAVIAVTKLNSEGMNVLLASLKAPAALSGFIVAILILSPEGAGAFSAILQNKTQRAMNLLLGSVLATIALTVPVVVAIALITRQRLELGLSLPSLLLMLATFMTCQVSLTGGKTNTHSGAAHLTLFIIYMMLLFS